MKCCQECKKEFEVEGIELCIAGQSFHFCTMGCFTKASKKKFDKNPMAQRIQEVTTQGGT